MSWSLAGWLLLTFAWGVLASASEIISRYRDEPLLAVLNRPGLSYLLLNGLLADAVHLLIISYPGRFPDALKDPLLASVTAGFGSMILLRSKLFIFRGEDGKDYPIGPAIAMETLLRMLDRKIDRLRASARQQRVFDAMSNLSDFESVANYFQASLLSFQNLGEDEKGDLVEIINDYRTQTTWPDTLRTMAIGFAFLTIAGEGNFDQVISNLKKYISLKSPTDSSSAGP